MIVDGWDERPALEIRVAEVGPDVVDAIGASCTATGERTLQPDFDLWVPGLSPVLGRENGVTSLQGLEMVGA